MSKSDREGFSGGIPGSLTEGAALENALTIGGNFSRGRGGTGRRWRLKIRSKIHQLNDLPPGEGPSRGGTNRFTVRFWTTRAPYEVPFDERFDDLDSALARGETLWATRPLTAIQVLIDEEDVVWEMNRH